MKMNSRAQKTDVHAGSSPDMAMNRILTHLCVTNAVSEGGGSCGRKVRGSV